MNKITVPDVLKKHLKIVGYLAISGLISYGMSLVADRPELIYATPLVNYVLYAIKLELDKSGYIEAIKNK